MVLTIQKNAKKILFFLLFGAHMCAAENSDNYVKYAKNIMNPFISQSEKQYDLECIGTGGKFAYNVAGINIRFVAYRRGTIEEARRLEVNLIETLLTHINESIEIRPFLSQYPFVANNLDISISFQKKDDSNYSDGSVALSFLAKGNIYYCAEDPKTKKLVDLLVEPYPQAVKIVNNIK
jgi:hypothetical protein